MNTETKLTSGSITRHLIRLSIPASMGMIFNTLYNLTDFWFAGLLSDQALAGVSIAGSVFFLLLAIGIGMQTGTSAVLAPLVGQNNLSAVHHWLNYAIGLGIALSAVTLMLGWWLAEPLVVFLGAESNVSPLSMQYLVVTLIGNVFFTLTFVAAGALMAMGDTKSNRNALAVGFIANFALNPLLTFVLEFGVSGLALATVLIKAATALYLFRVLRQRLGKPHRPRYDKAHWKELSGQVLPASFNMLTIILGGFITVAFIGRFGSEHVAGYAVGLRLEQVLLLPALGLNAAVMALAGQNFGAGQPDRVAETYKRGLQIGLAMAVVCMPIMIFLSPQLMTIFTANETISTTGATYLAIDAFAFYGYTVLFIGVAVLQSLKQPMFPMFLGMARQFIVPATINYWLIVHSGLPMVSVFYTIVSVVLLSALVSHWYTKRQLQNLAKYRIFGRYLNVRPLNLPLEIWFYAN